MQKYDCLGIGLAPLDYLSLVAQFPKPGLKLEVLEGVTAGGGPVPTALATLSRLGMRTAFVGKLGNDAAGRLCLDAFRQAGISRYYISVAANRITPTATVLVESDTGRRTVLLARGKGCRLGVSDIDAKIISRTRALHLDGRDLSACRKAAKLAHKLGVITFLDVGSLRNRVDSLFSLIDHLVVAQEYARQFTGARKVERAIKRLWQPPMSSLVVTMGQQGAVGYDGNHLIRQRAYRVKVKDTTGAGDTYHGAYIYGVLTGRSIAETMRFAAAVAALNCRELGGRRGLPTLVEVDRLIRKGRLV
ncbi:MAG: hypothetical protein KAT58_01810 [candidate division Zixibacteria bacterium]|nr:hypothetical protein [candidate division Zixibacteria bacterium]